jgi:hypothetical protein
MVVVFDLIKCVCRIMSWVVKLVAFGLRQLLDLTNIGKPCTCCVVICTHDIKARSDAF